MPRPDPDKALGCLVGLAVCEALAGSGANPPADDDALVPGLWGDGTAMALSLAESLIQIRGVDQRDQMVRYTSWLRYGYLSSTETCDFIDPVVKEAITRFERTWDPVDRDGAGGDACLARVAPVAMYFGAAREAVLSAVAESTVTTHSDPQSLDACRRLAAMVCAALHGADRPAVVREGLAIDAGPEGGSPDEKTASPADAPARRSLQTARDVFLDSATFARGARRCLPHGPRVLAAYGQLAGAWHGARNIPLAWRHSLAQRNLLEAIANQLLAG